MNFGSVCSGIEAASVAWHPLGWRAAWLAEIEDSPSAILAHHYPDVPNLGDMTGIAARITAGEIEAPDVLVGGTPCQAFSVAGLRMSLADARGNLSLAFVELANAIDDLRRHRGQPAGIIVWENVPGVLNTSDNAFGCFVGGMAGCDTPIIHPQGSGWHDAGVVVGPQRTVAWRVLDAQYFGLAQRRRRVFVVASARIGFDPAAVLLEFDGLRRDTPPSRESQQGAAAGTLRSTDGGSDVDHAIAQHLIPETVGTLCADSHPGSYTGQDAYTGRLIPHVAHSLRAEGFDASEDGTGRGTPLSQSSQTRCGGIGGSNQELFEQGGAGLVPVAFPANLSGTQCASTENLAPAMGAKNTTAVASAMQVRRLTPRECERLQHHAAADVSGRHYDKYSYLREKQAAMAQWSVWLDNVLSGHSPESASTSSAQPKPNAEGCSVISLAFRARTAT